tara:strand:- start:1108 stop:1449 length:342 start_codon:yes stop_codon:yes gene_type:complete
MQQSNLYFYRAKITKVYDGDTCTALVDLGFGTQQTMKLRLADINAPEIRGEERPKGLESRDFLRNLILDKEVIIETKRDKKGKYGRYIAKIWIEDKCVNDLLVESSHAVYHQY